MRWPPEKRRARRGQAPNPSENSLLGSNDGPNLKLEISVSQLLPRPVRPDELPELRRIWWSQAAAGFRLPAEAGVILIEGGRS